MINSSMQNETLTRDPAKIAICTIYFTMGVFGILENAVITILMATDSEMRNPTYLYMINLGICDVIAHVPLGIYAGLAILYPRMITYTVIGIFAYWISLSWYPGCFFMVLASFSRYVQLGKAHDVEKYFTKRNLILSISLAWLVPAVVYTWMLWWTPPGFTFFVHLYTWGFDRGQSFGNAWSYVNITVNSICALIINIFNAYSLIWVHRMGKEVQILKNNHIQQREIKLFVQCALTGSIYTTAVICYFVFSELADTPFTFVIGHILWVLNHLQNPIIYLALNTRLRQRFCILMKCKWIWDLKSVNLVVEVEETPGTVLHPVRV